MTTRDRINDYADSTGEEIILLEPEMFDDAIVGVAERAGGMLVVAYDRNRCVDIIQADSKCSREEAEEYYEFNTACAWMGDGTPVFIDTRIAE